MSLGVGSSSSDYGLKTSGTIDANAAYTWMAWVTLTSDTNDYGHIWASLGTAGDTYTDADWIGTDADGTTVRWGSYAGGGGTSGVNSSLTVNTPAHLTLVRTSTTNLIAYLNGVLIGSPVTTNVGSRAATQREQLGSLFLTYEAPSQITAMKQWQAALTVDEIAAEMRAIRPLRFANLHSWHPAIAAVLADLYKDYSGNGRDWTANGTLTVGDIGAPVSWGAGQIWPQSAAGGAVDVLYGQATL